MDRLGRPRSDIHAFTMPGFATGDTTKSYATRLAKSLGVTFEELDITAAARQMLVDIDHPFADGKPVYDVTFENVQAGLRYDYLFRLANHRGGIVVGTGDLSELALGWCTYGVGDQMSHYNVNAGVPEDAGPAPDPLGGRAAASSTRRPTSCSREIVEQEITPELIPTERGRAAAVDRGHRSVPTPSRTSRSSTCSATATGRAGSRSWPGTPGTTRTRGSGRPASPRQRRTAYDLGEVRHWLEVFIEAVLRQPVQALGAPQRPQGQRRRHHVAARRLADALRREPHRLAGRAGGNVPLGG